MLLLLDLTHQMLLNPREKRARKCRVNPLEDADNLLTVVVEVEHKQVLIDVGANGRVGGALGVDSHLVLLGILKDVDDLDVKVSEQREHGAEEGRVGLVVQDWFVEGRWCTACG